MEILISDPAGETLFRISERAADENFCTPYFGYFLRNPYFLFRNLGVLGFRISSLEIRAPGVDSLSLSGASALEVLPIHVDLSIAADFWSAARAGEKTLGHLAANRSCAGGPGVRWTLHSGAKPNLVPHNGTKVSPIQIAIGRDHNSFGCECQNKFKSAKAIAIKIFRDSYQIVTGHIF